MERVTGIGGVFFRAHRPEVLERWYAERLGVDPAPPSYDVTSWWQQPGPTVFAALAADSEHFGDAEHSWAVTFRVADLAAMVGQLRAAGEVVAVDPVPYPNGRFAELRDPEGNLVHLWEPAGADLQAPG